MDTGTIAWITVAAIIIGPIAAVQTQKFLEKGSASKNRKLFIFKTLMATRGSILSMDHVGGLNRIDLEFYPIKKYKKVLDAWKNYFDNLSREWKTDSQRDVIVNQRNELLADLLYEMGKSLGYKFDKLSIKRNVYTPKGHQFIEQENQSIRTGLIEILSGKESLPIQVSGVAADAEGSKRLKDLQELLIIYYTRENNKALATGKHESME